MTETKHSNRAYVVLREVADGNWQVIGEVNRRPGLPARAARAQAVQDATEGRATADEVYAAILRSEWRIAFDF